MSEFLQSKKVSNKSNLIGIAVVVTLFGIFGLTTNAANADSNETSPDSDNAYIQSSISAGGNSTCVLLAGAAKCWGANESGQLGNGTTTASFALVTVSGLTSGVTAISVGNNHACAVVSGGVKCWGANESGQLGNASTTASFTPVSVQGLTTGVTAVSVGGSAGWMGNSSFSCAVVSGGVKCWGANASGQLGDNSTTASQIPVAVSGLTSGVTAISLGSSHACAVNASALKCWGTNSNGQAGPTAFAATQVVGLTSGVTAISAAAYGEPHVCAIQSGSLKCWGYNSAGQLGDGSTSNAHTPQQVIGLTAGVTAVSGFSCAVVSASCTYSLCRMLE